MDTHMLPRPCLATISDANRFGSEVPAAVTVRPITSSGISRMQPDDSAPVIMTLAMSAMSTTDRIIVAGYQLVYFGSLTSGMVYLKTQSMGKTK